MDYLQHLVSTCSKHDRHRHQEGEPRCRRAVKAAVHARVEARQPLVVLEAMKMETPLTAPYAGTVAEVHVAEGDRVAGGTLLVELGP